MRAEEVWWINAASSLIRLVRVFLTFELNQRENRLLQVVVVGIIYVGALLSVVAYVFNAPVGTLIATSGAVAIILGLALQSTLGDLFSGIALNLARSYGIDHWLVLGSGIEGGVVETNWRATHLLTAANDLVVVPNSDLAKARLTNLSSPERSHGVTLRVRFRPTTMPSAIVDVMRSVLLSSDSILQLPEPTVQVVSLDGSAVELELTFAVADIGASGTAKTEIFDLIYRHAKAAGLGLSQPPEALALGVGAHGADDPQFGQHTTPRRLLDSLALFASLSDDERDSLVATMVRRTFKKGDVLAEQGAVLRSLVILRSGVVAVICRDEGRVTELGHLAPGDFFGEGGLLTGAGEHGNIEAVTFVVTYEITQEGLASVMRDRPAIADEIAGRLSNRFASEMRRLGPGNLSEQVKTKLLRARIRQLFDL